MLFLSEQRTRVAVDVVVFSLPYDERSSECIPGGDGAAFDPRGRKGRRGHYSARWLVFWISRI